MKKIGILGSTGSIGTQTLDVAREHRDKIKVNILSAQSNIDLLEKQLMEFSPKYAVVTDKEAFEKLKNRYSGSTKILYGDENLVHVVSDDSIDTVITSLMGFAGLKPTVAAIKQRKNIALANKETLVVAGDIIMNMAKEYNVSIMPIDSEHGAIFQCLNGERKSEIKKILLTASGGPFLNRSREYLQNVTVEECLKHPTWNMGKKITIDSATLMNKGLEIIEAKYLYDLSYDQIKVVVHPQSMIHSMVEFVDGSIMAQIASTDMKIPIQYALSYPDRWQCSGKSLDFWDIMDFKFIKPDFNTFKGLDIAYRAGREGGIMPCVMNGANEVAVEEFLNKKIGFLDIYDLIYDAMEHFTNIENPDLEELFNVDKEIRIYTKEKIGGR